MQTEKEFNSYYGQATPNWDPSTYVVDIEVWKSLKTVGRDVSKEREANVFIDLPSTFLAATNTVKALQGYGRFSCPR
jgi:hypothetical protein